MVKHIATMIERIVQFITPEDILNGTVDCRKISLAELQKIYFATEGKQPEASIEKKLEYLADWIVSELQENGISTDIRKQKWRMVQEVSFYDLVQCLVKKVLRMKDEEVVFRYEKLEAWHRISSQIGAELFVAAAYAMADIRYGIRRDEFVWKNVIDHDNYRLKSILDKGVSDNHYHLNASLPYFDLSWISLMNFVNSKDLILKMDALDKNSRNIRKQYVTAQKKEPYSLLHLKAALIRVYLYAVLTDQLIAFGEYSMSAEKLLHHIVTTEKLNDSLGSISFPEDMHGSICEALEYHTDEETVWNRDWIEIHYPGFYWFFWKIYPEIPLDVLVRRDVFLCEENICSICEYAKREYSNVLLSDCRWLYQGQDYEEYRREWKRQTKQTVYCLLKNPYRMMESRKYIQGILDGFQRQRTLGQKDYIQNEVQAIGSNLGNVIAGERWLTYYMFYNRSQTLREELESREDIYNLFFVYLIIKDLFRREMLYNNEKIGFTNFQIFQKRKNWFTTNFSQGELAQISVQDAFSGMNLNSLELRVKPEDTCDDNIRMIQHFDAAISDYGKHMEYIQHTYYVFHFPKRKDTQKFNERRPRCRHEEFRRKLRNTTNEILRMREKNRAVGDRLKGIDACSSEDGCRPEVFADCFRVLRDHTVQPDRWKHKVDQLRMSYHVGEENQDVLDGIRAIDEAVLFLNMRSGDRLGHATMLGVSASEWYYRNYYMISIRQLDYLDNVAWLYHKIVQYHLPNHDNLLEYLEQEYHTYFERVYREALDKEYLYIYQNLLGKDENDRVQIPDFDIYTYYASWELRGDNPEYYKTVRYKKCTHRVSLWEDNAMNPRVDYEKRYMDKAVILYHAYHYSTLVRENGNRSIVKDIPHHMVNGIQMVQKEMMKEIASLGISIETNPSSNLLIGGLTGYDHHPIVTFYNRDLYGDRSKEAECAQLHVSINTDDLGVFITSLSNEYTLMAKALESSMDQNGHALYSGNNVYEWLDHIREMGNEQSFNRKLYTTENEGRNE